MKKNISLENLRGLNLRSDGLSDEEVQSQRRVFGPNIILEQTPSPWGPILCDTAKDPMVLLLVVAGSLFLFLGNNTEAFTLYFAIIPLIAMDIYLHYRTQASTRVLQGQLDRRTWVYRGNKKIEIDSIDLVPGDRVCLKTGDYLSADGFFEEVDRLLIDESLLTGESLPITKGALSASILLSAEEVTVTAETLGFAGTRVVRGEAVLRVTQTGANSQYGDIVRALSKAPHEKTPLQQSIAKLVKVLTIGGLICCVLLITVRLLQAKGWLDAFLSGAILAVAAMPEEFPIVFSFYLGVGIYRLAKKNALVRRAVTVENIGQVECICTDKTGTITLGELRLVQRQAATGISEEILLESSLMSCDENPTDPVDVAIAAGASGQRSFKRDHSFPFTEDRKKESSIYKNSEDQFVCVSKGAPEVILAMSDLSEAEQNHWLEQIKQWSESGQKVLGCARKFLKSEPGPEEPQEHFQFCGLLGFSDPLRPEVPAAMTYCFENKIKVIMLTGDHPHTALAIGTQAGVGGAHPRVLSMEGREEFLTEQGIQDHALEISDFDIVARCKPLQKLWIVEALKKRYKVVAVTGDGVNDVPALHRADIGIAMGKRGSRAAREVSSIILADDNFATITHAIGEGKQLLRNLTLSFEYLLLMQIPFVLGAALIPLAGYPLLFLPVHLVWIELILHPTSLFAFQMPTAPADPSLAPRRFFDNKKIVAVTIEGFLLLSVMIFSFVLGLHEDKGEGHARANALLIFCLASAGYVWRSTGLKTRASRVIFLATLVTTFIFIQSSTLASRLGLHPLDFLDWVRGMGLVLAVGLSAFYLRKKIL